MRSHYGFKFNSHGRDAKLYEIAVLALEQLVLAGVKVKQIHIDEFEVEATFLYRYKVRGLIAYVGREKDTHKVKFLLLDQNRIAWAEQEGFFEDPSFTIDDVYTKIGVMRRLPNVGEFVKFLSGVKFEAMGDYILSSTA